MKDNDIYSILKTTMGYKQALDYKVWCFVNDLNANAVTTLNAYFKRGNIWTTKC